MPRKQILDFKTPEEARIYGADYQKKGGTQKAITTVYKMKLYNVRQESVRHACQEDVGPA